VTPQDIVLTPMGCRFRGQLLPCTIGRGGLRGDKHEGDGATPVGVHHITGLLYRPDRVARPAPWATEIGPADLWSDAADQPDYNQWVRAPYGASCERLSRADHLYDLVLLTDWNWPVSRPSKGSAIFLHRWRKPGHPTEGCIAFDPQDFRWLCQNAAPGTRLIVPPLAGKSA